MTVEGAPHLRDEHLAVFDCANKCGAIGKRYIDYARPRPYHGGGAAVHQRRDLEDDQHAEPTASVDDVKTCYRTSWELMIKALALYRDGSKLSQPLNAVAI